MLSLQHLTANIGEKNILRDISLDFLPGKTYAIMGPNGSGKSTLAGSVMGHPALELSPESKIIYDGEEIQELEADERAKKGIFLSVQSPLALTGVTVFQLLRFALDGKKDPLVIKREVEALAERLQIRPELLARSLNDGFSGGERKKMEVLQAAVLDPRVAFFDEIDTGVDVDALRTIAEFLAEWRGGERTIAVITHYNRILKYLKPDEVIVIRDGQIAARGGAELAERIEAEGYEGI
jgi:Fe-S cluster assembly ATP-binding protein